MAEPPPPTNPPPGWYPDPSEGAGAKTGAGYRWWDGAAWTETTTDDAGLAAAGAALASTKSESALGPIGPWLSDSFRLVISRFGHWLPIILFFVLSIAIPTSYGLWYGLRDTVLTFDPDTAVPEVDYGGNAAWLIAAAVAFPLATLLAAVAKAAAIRHSWAATIDSPEQWSDSVRDVLTRWRRILPASFGRTLLYWVINGLFVIGVALSPLTVLLFPFFIVLLVGVWLRLCFVTTVATLGSAEDRPFATSWRLSGTSQIPLLGRLLVLAFVSLNMVLAAGILGAPFTALAGGGGSAGVQPSAETLILNDVMGPNPSVFALGSAFNALGLGLNYILAAAGTTLLYRRLGGPSSGFVPAPAVEPSNDRP